MGVDGQDKNEEDKDLELDLMAEQELLRLTRQYRVMEGDKEAYLEEATKALRRQRKITEDLDRDKNELLRLLKTTRSKRSSRKESENAAKLARLAEEQESLMSSLQHEKLISRDLGAEIRRIERQLANQRRAVAAKAGVIITAEAKQEAAPAKAAMAMREKKDIGQRIVLLENRLDGVMINFNATLSKNSSVRKEIDHLVQERSSFNDLIAKYQKRISANKKVIADITELAIQAFDQRDECQSKVQALQERNEKDAQQYAAELKELQRTLDHDEKLKDFLFNKSNDRVLAAQFEEDEAERGKRAAEEKELEDVQRYKEAFERIREVVGAADASLEKIVADFVKVEDQNFALFNYVTEMNNQVEALQEGIGRLKGDIKEAKGRGEERERQQREQLMAMEKKLETSTHEADSAETKLELMESVIGKLKVGTEDLYLGAKVGSTPVLALLGGQQQQQQQRPFVSESNVIMYLDMIHEKIVELKGIAQFLDWQEAGGKEDLALHFSKLAVAHRSPMERHLRRMPSSAQVLGKDDNDLGTDDKGSGDEEGGGAEVRPFDMSALKTRAFVVVQRERKEASLAAYGDGGNAEGGITGTGGGGKKGKHAKNSKK